MLAIPHVDWGEFDGRTYHSIHIGVQSKLGGVLRKEGKSKLALTFHKKILARIGESFTRNTASKHYRMLYPSASVDVFKVLARIGIIIIIP